VIDGGHFFIDTARAELINAIVASIKDTLTPAAFANRVPALAPSAVSRTAFTDSAGAAGPRSFHS
jgi:hypothetical protein